MSAGTDIIYSAGHYATKAAQHPYSSFVKAALLPRFWFIATVLATITGAQLSFFFNPKLGVFLAATATLSLLSIAFVKETVRSAALSASLVPLVTLLAVSLSIQNTLGRMLALYAAMFALAVTYRRMFAPDERPASVLEEKPTLPVIAGLAFAGIIGWAAYEALGASGIYAGTPLGVMAGLAIIFAVIEELFFRGLIQKQAARILQPGIAAFISAVLFAGFQLVAATPAAAGIALLSGTILAAIYYKTERLIPVILVNAASKLIYIAILAAIAF